MKWLKLTAFTFLISSVVLLSCNEEDIFNKHEYSNNFIAMSSAQEVPATPVPSTAIGNVQASYSQETKILTYKVTWSGLTANASAAHIHGTGEAGVAAGVMQSFVGFPAATSGTYSGTFFVDGVKILEEYLLAGKYYVNIHTSNNPGGEIRGQLILYKR